MAGSPSAVSAALVAVAAALLVISTSATTAHAALTHIDTVHVKALPAMPANLGGKPVPLSLATGFAQGDIPSGSTARLLLNGSCTAQAATQFFCLRAWPDGSCKHGHFAAALTANEAETIRSNPLLPLHILEDDAPGTVPTPKTAAEAAARITALRAAVTVSIGNSTAMYEVGPVIATGEWSLRFGGDVMSEVVARVSPTTSTSTPHPNVEVEVVARVWHTAEFVEFDIAVDNIKAQLSASDNVRGYSLPVHDGDSTYDAQITLSNGARSLSSTSVTHWWATRWRFQQLWPLASNARSMFHIAPNMEYLSFSKLIPNYDYAQRAAPTQAERDSAWSTFQASDRGILGRGVVTSYMPQTGGRGDIGVLPDWAARYAFAPEDERMAEIVLHASTAGGAWGTHINTYIETEPKLTASDGAYGRQIISQGSCPNTADCAHQPSMHYLPYLLTADKFSGDELLHWANFAQFKSNPGADSSVSAANRYRGRDRGYLAETTRGTAWCLRNTHHAAEILPAGYSTSFGAQSFSATVVENNLATFAQDMAPANPWGFFTNLMPYTQRPFNDAWYPGTFSLVSPWQDDYFVCAMNSWTSDLSPNGETFRNWLSNWTVQRFQPRTDFDRSYAAPYRFAGEIVVPPGSSNAPQLVQTWDQLWHYSFGGQGGTTQTNYAITPPLDGNGDAGASNPTSCTACYPTLARGACRLIKANGFNGDAAECSSYLSNNLANTAHAFEWSFADTAALRPSLAAPCGSQQPVGPPPPAPTTTTSTGTGGSSATGATTTGAATTGAATTDAGSSLGVSLVVGLGASLICAIVV